MRLATKWRWWAGAATLGILLTGASACTSSDEATIAGEDDQVEVEVVPEDPTDVDDPTQFAFGQEVKVVDGGVEPKLLAADIGGEISIRNTTGAAVEVLFTNPGWNAEGTTTTGPLEPGAAFVVDPIGVASITYQVAGTDITGIIQVEEGLDDI